MQGIETKYHGPTNYKGARISAQGTGARARRIYLPYAYELNQYENHARAANHYAIMSGWKKGQYASAGTARGYIFAPIVEELAIFANELETIGGANV